MTLGGFVARGCREIISLGDKFQSLPHYDHVRHFRQLAQMRAIDYAAFNEIYRKQQPNRWKMCVTPSGASAAYRCLSSDAPYQVKKFWIKLTRLTAGES